MDARQEFAAIDFETANCERSSVCSVGIVRMRGGEVVEQFYSLIHPTPNWYSWRCVEVHGLSERDTRYAPLFPEVWTRCFPLLWAVPVVAHNASFDYGCLNAVCAAYHLPQPLPKFQCTYQAARRYFGHRLPNLQLQTVSAACGYSLTRHHHALADAEACARIAQQIIFNQ